MLNRSLVTLLVTQFLSAFADNAILFAASAIIVRDAYPAGYLPLVQSFFLCAYIVLAPWAGRLADRIPKARVLCLGNLIKAAGAILFLLQLDPAIAYAVVGIGAVLYSPAKYGILPFLSGSGPVLLSANAALESLTIVAILAGSVAGGFLSDTAISLALTVCLVLYLLSAAASRLIPDDAGDPAVTFGRALPEFFRDTVTLFRQRESSFSLIGTGLFWLGGAVLRMILFAWAPLHLAITTQTGISLLLGATGVGIALGSILTPWLIPAGAWRRTPWYGLGMALAIALVPFCFSKGPVIVLLILSGMAGGIFIVPMNTLLQQIGRISVGTGRTIAVQNFVENVAMFGGVALYAGAARAGIPPDPALFAVAAFLALGAGGLLLTLRQSD